MKKSFLNIVSFIITIILVLNFANLIAYGNDDSVLYIGTHQYQNVKNSNKTYSPKKYIFTAETDGFYRIYSKYRSNSSDCNYLEISFNHANPYFYLLDDDDPTIILYLKSGESFTVESIKYLADFIDDESGVYYKQESTLSSFDFSINYQTEDFYTGSNNQKYKISINDKSATVLNYYYNETILDMPSTIKGVPIVEIGEYAFKNCYNLTEVIIPSGIHTIRDYAFANCIMLKRVVVNNSNCNIGKNAFWNCPKNIEIIGCDFDINHNLYKTVIKATPYDDGCIEEKCVDCEKVFYFENIASPKIITLSTTKYVYDGKAKKPTVLVKDGKGNKISSANYTVTYLNNTKVGKATVKIVFKGNYSGTVTRTFTIVPKTTSISSLTATSKSFTVKWKKQATQTTGYQIQIATDSNFTKGVKTYTITKNSTLSKKITKLTGKKRYYVRIRTYKTVSGTKYYSSWSAKKYVTTKK